MHYAKKENTVGELLSDLSWDVQNLVRQELLLAKNEMTGKVSRGVKDMKSVATGGAVLYAGVLGIMAGIILLLGVFIPFWISALVIGVIVALAGYSMVRKGANDMKRLDITPHETISSLKEDKKWMKESA